MTSASPEETPGPCRILLLAALPMEVRPFLRRTQARRRRGLPWPAWEFALAEVRGLLALTGMGDQAAHEAAARLTAQFPARLLISFGFGGALNPGLNPGDLVLGESLSRYDPATGVLVRLTPPTPPKPLPAMLSTLKAAGLAAYPGHLITTPAIIHKAAQGGPLTSFSHPVLDLETAAVAAVAREAGLAFLGLRAVTDTAGEEIPGFLSSAGAEFGQVRLLDALGWLAADPRRLKDLTQLWRRCRLAAPTLAAALLTLLPSLP